MAAVLKRKYEKPMIKFVTDMNIILECLYEVYGQEEHHVLEGVLLLKLFTSGYTFFFY